MDRRATIVAAEVADILTGKTPGGGEAVIRAIAAAIQAAVAADRDLILEHVAFLKIPAHPDPDFMAGFNRACDLIDAAIRHRP